MVKAPSIKSEGDWHKEQMTIVSVWCYQACYHWIDITDQQTVVHW